MNVLQRLHAVLRDHPQNGLLQAVVLAHYLAQRGACLLLKRLDLRTTDLHVVNFDYPVKMQIRAEQNVLPKRVEQLLIRCPAIELMHLQNHASLVLYRLPHVAVHRAVQYLVRNRIHVLTARRTQLWRLELPLLVGEYLRYLIFVHQHTLLQRFLFKLHCALQLVL